MAGSFVQPNPAEFLGILPEILLVLWSVVIVGIDLAAGRKVQRRALGVMSGIGMLVILAVAVIARPAEGQVILGGMIRNDVFTYVFRIIFIAAGALSMFIATDFRPLRANGEFFGILTLSVMAMCLMAGSNDLIMLYLATETASFSLYLMAAFMRSDKLSAEAGVKYFVFGAVTSTVMLFGLSLFFGLSQGSTNYGAVADAIRNPDLRVPVTFASLLVLVGFAFKTSAVPFHFWAPDVYQGAPTPVSGFISTASKAAGFAILIRFLYYILPPGTSEASLAWAQVMQPIAMLTMTLGSLLALVQKDVKRMLAYSSVSQAGYIFIGVTALALGGANQAEALAAVIFYIGIYMVTNIVAFGVTGVIEQRVGGTDTAKFNGLGRRSPYLALAMTAALLSLLGAPPLVGFVGKLFLFQAAIGVSLVGLVVVAVINVLISVVYYLNVVRAMYVEKTEHDSAPLFVPAPTTVTLVISAAGIVVLTIASMPFWNLALDAARSFFGVAGA